jgi:hypothetical protein
MRNVLVVGLLFAFGNAFAQPTGGDKKPAPAPAAKPAEKPAPAAKPAEKPAAGAPAAAMEPPPPPKAGPETDALKPFAPKSATMTGKSPAGAYGPNSPEMATKGKVSCKWIMNNLFAMCDIEDTMGTGKTAMKWMGHQMMGWDFGAKEYRSTMVDSFGGVVMMKGKLEGSKLSWESMTDAYMMGQPTKFRISFDATDPKAIKMTGEHTGPDKKWVVDEESVIKAGGK